MGGGRWDSAAWSSSRVSYSATAAPTVDHIYKSKELKKELDTSQITLRESRDSAANPNSTAVILGLDVTGSMGPVLDVMARTGLGTLVEQIYTRKPISDPHIMIMGIGDVEYDRAPLQATQFEAENDKLVAQMESIYLELGGGRNDHESYAAAWFFAATRTSIDCFEKRRKRGYLFTVGDEMPTPYLSGAHIKRLFGDEQAPELSGAAILEMAQVSYNVFHVIVEKGSYARTNRNEVNAAWAHLLGQQVLHLADHRHLAEVIVSAIQVAEGADRDVVARSWDEKTKDIISTAIRDIAVGTNIASRDSSPPIRLY